MIFGHTFQEVRKGVTGKRCDICSKPILPLLKKCYQCVCEYIVFVIICVINLSPSLSLSLSLPLSPSLSLSLLPLTLLYPFYSQFVGNCLMKNVSEPSHENVYHKL